MGGGDIDPHAYGASLHSETKIEDVRRDALEILLAQRAEKDKKPILGICRGHQVMAVAGGGSLIQHVPEIAPGESHAVKAYAHLRNEGTGHSVILTPESRIAAVLQKTKIQVTSGHHQAVKDPGAGMRIVGYSPGGIPEIIESTEERFAYGVQCHPEAEDVKDLEPLFAAFGEAVRGWKAV
jgi:putative glutamine amidotransferase